MKVSDKYNILLDISLIRAFRREKSFPTYVLKEQSDIYFRNTSTIQYLLMGYFDYLKKYTLTTI